MEVEVELGRDNDEDAESQYEEGENGEAAGTTPGLDRAAVTNDVAASVELLKSRLIKSIDEAALNARRWTARLARTMTRPTGGESGALLR